MKAPDLALTDLGCACATSRQVARILTQLYDSQMRSTGIEAPQFALLMTLEKQGPCSQVEIGRRYVLDKTTVSRNLQQLERNGWVEAKVGTDRRVREFVLTPKGKARLTAAKPEWKKAQARLQSTMSSREWDEMFQVFRKVTEKARALFDQ